SNLKPRKARNRAEELDEATIDLIPRVYEGNTEEVAIMLRRARMVGVKLDSKAGAKPLGPDAVLSFDQVQALAKLTSNHSTWFTDGDGKRTSHAWDNEYAVPAIKAAAMQQYVKDLQNVKRSVSHLPIDNEVDGVIRELRADLKHLTAVRDAAKDHMLALTKLQSYAEQHGVTQTRDEVGGELGELRKEAKAKGEVYRRLIENQDVATALSHNASAKVLGLVKKLKGVEAAGEARFDKLPSSFDGQTALSNLDSLIIKASKGDFPMKVERRENANQHKYALRYLLKALSNSGNINDLTELTVPGSQPPVKLTKTDISGARRCTSPGPDDEMKDSAREVPMPGDEHRLRVVLEALNDLAYREAKGMPMSDKEREVIRTVKKTTEGCYNTAMEDIFPEYHAAPDARPLELDRQESVFLDDVSPFYLSGKYYPGAFKRVVIAEAGSPPNDMLSKGVQDDIRKEAVLRDSNDVMTANLFKNLLGSKVDVVPLYEDPDAILHTPAMLANKLRKPVYHDALGIDFDKASKRTLKRMDGSEISGYEFMKAQGYSDQQMTARNMKIDDLKRAKVYVGPHKMLANSDSAKRGTLAASTLNQISLVESYEAAARNLVVDNKHNQHYLYVNQVYLGQGGALARTTGTDATVNTITEQGQHQTFTTGLYSAMKSVLRGVTRLVNRVSNYEDGRGGLPDDARKRVALETMSLGNPYAFRTDVDTMQQMKQVALKAIRKRIATTRDDVPVPGTGGNGNGNGASEPNTRYEEMLKKYGEDFIENYSARPAAKGGKVNFVGIRAIGLAGKEFGFFSNIVGVSEMFDINHEGRLTNVSLMAKLYTSDPSVKHNFDAAAYTANLSYKTLPKVWEKGGITMNVNGKGEVELTKNGQTSKLSELVTAFHNNETSYSQFDAADLALANVHQQTVNFVNGLAQIRAAVALGPSAAGEYTLGGAVPPVSDPIELIPEHLRGTVRHARELAGNLASYFREMESKPGVITEKDGKVKLASTPDGQSLRMAKDTYYQLMETSLEQQALSRVPYVGRAA
ncbi:MAG: hypothetical protein EBV03_05410, partial [Proteobacteria bacterium]|nr:hypothetical protein [Pseudomonadota bacterium]